MTNGEILEIAVECDSEAAEAVSELFNRFNGGGYDEDTEAGEASGGGAVVETTGYDDFGQPIAGEFRLIVKTYIKPGERGAQIRRQIEEGLWFLSRIYPIPEPLIRTVREECASVVWVCDPMHGNTVKSASGFKTRPFDAVLREVQEFFAIHRAEGTVPGGVHFEMTGQDVTECTGGVHAVRDENLADRYHTACDPRLNASQSLELAFLVAGELSALRAARTGQKAGAGAG